MPKVKSLSIFFPVYNDAKSIQWLLQKANSVAKNIANDYEILVINDGSKDNTKSVLELLQSKYKKLKVINHPKNRGYGAALFSGFESSKKEWIFYTDGDGQYDPQELTNLVKRINKQTDVVNGYKLSRADSAMRKFLGGLYNLLIHFLYSIPISDVDCDFRLIRKSKIQNIKLTTSGGTVCLELILKLQRNKARFAEVGVHHYPRKYGHSQFFNIKNIFKMLLDSCAFYLRYHILQTI